MGEKRAGLQRGGKIWDDKQLWTWWRTKSSRPRPTVTCVCSCSLLSSRGSCYPAVSVMAWAWAELYTEGSVVMAFRQQWGASRCSDDWLRPLDRLFSDWFPPPRKQKCQQGHQRWAGSQSLPVLGLGWGGGRVDETKQKIWQTRSEEIWEAGQLRYLVMWLQSDRLPGSGCVSVCCYASEDCGDRRHVLQGVKVREGEGKRAWPGGGTPFVSF